MEAGIEFELLKRVTELTLPHHANIVGLDEHSIGSSLEVMFASDIHKQALQRSPTVCTGRATREEAVQPRLLRTGNICVLVRASIRT